MAVAIAVVGLTSALLTAQRTWIVNPNGSGDFLDLPPAVAASSSGDTILVQGHNLTPTRVDKGLRIIGDVGGGLAIGPGGLLLVENLPSTETFVLGNFASLSQWEPQLALHFRDCQGRIHVGRVKFAWSGDPIQTRQFVTIERCASVSFHDCRLADVTVRDSTVLFTHDFIYGDGWPRISPQTGFPAIDAVDSDLTLVQCFVRGGRTVSGTPPSIPGIRMQGGRLRFTGDERVFWLESSRRVVSGTTWTGNGWSDGPAIHSDGGLVELDSRILLQRRQGTPGPLTTGTSRFVTRRIEMLSGNRENPIQGHDLQAHIFSAPGASAWVFVSVPTWPFTLPGLGDIWLDPRAVFLFGAGTVPASGPLSFSAPLPVGAFPTGTVFATQAVVFDQGTFRLTPPVESVLLPCGNLCP